MLDEVPRRGDFHNDAVNVTFYRYLYDPLKQRVNA